VVVPLREGAAPALFLVHELTGEVIVYRDLIKGLSVDVAVYGIQAVGLNREDTPLHDVREMAARYIREIREVQPEGPYLIGGLCFGGVVALEMAHQLEQAGAEVRLLVPIDAVPRSVAPRQMTLMERFYHYRGQLIERPGPRRLAGLARPLLTTVDRKRDAAWRKVSSTILASGRALPHRLDNVERYLGRAIRRYPVSPVVQCRVLMVRADKGERNTEMALRRWARHTTGPIDLVTVRGEGVDHVSMVRDPLVRQITEPLSTAISELAPARSGRAPQV